MDKTITQTKTETSVKTALTLGIISGICVAVSFLALAISAGQKILSLLG